MTDSLDYIWDGDKLIARKYYSYSDNEGMISQVIYDSEDEAIGFIVYGLETDTIVYKDVYLYRKNLQGDITGVLTYTGKLIAEYSYDAYGNVFIDTSKDIGLAISSIMMMLSNPLMYRGYVYTFLGDELAPNSKVKLDNNYLFSTYARYKKSKYLYNRLKIVFGDYYSWKNSSSAYNNKTKVYYDHYSSYVASGYANPKDGPWSYILVNNFALRPTILISMVTASAAKKVFNQIWGSSGIDKTNSKKLIVFKVTQDKNYNGVYYYSPSENNFMKVS